MAHMTQSDKFKSLLDFADKLSASLAKRYWRARQADDLRQVARIALWECSVRHVDGQGDLQAYARRRIYGACVDWLRTMSWFSRKNCKTMLMQSLQDQASAGTANYDGGDSEFDRFEGVTWDGEIGQDSTLHAVIKEEYARRVQEAIGLAVTHLSPKQRRMVEGVLGGVPQSELARELGISQGRASQILADATARLRSLSV